MKRKNKCKMSLILCAVCLSTALFSGCDTTEHTQVSQTNHTAVVSMEETPIIDYVVPQFTPNILVNHHGYYLQGDKTAALKGSKLPEKFSLVDVDNEVVVFSGTINDIVYDEELGIYIGYADFSDYRAEGDYYLEAEHVGRSLTFSVDGKLYQELFEELYHTLLGDDMQQGDRLLESVALLTAYEWYPTIFEDEDADEIPDILEVFAEQIAKTQIGEKETEEVLYAAFLAKFSYLYQKFDKEYATDCLRQASVLFEQAQKNMQKDAQSFFALTELYRATGYYTYRNQIADYKSYFENNTSYLEETEYLYGAMTYLATRQKVDVALCDIFMNHLMDKGEEVASRYEDMIHPVTAKNNGDDDLLKRGMQLSCVNYVLNNYQYNRIMEELAHYLMGKNMKSVCFYPNDGSNVGYIALLAQLAAVYDET